MKSWSDYVGQNVASRWHLQSLLGVGSFGAVYETTANRSGDSMVVRLLNPKIGGATTFDPDVFTNFQHTHAIEVSEVGIFEETRYLVMRRASGAPLSVREAWAGDQVLELVRQIGAVLIAFQKQFDLQHLHLHPSNVTVEVAPGKKPRFQLADLGLASQVGAGELILEAIRERRTTPEFLSPEQLQGHAPSPQSDVYAFGAMLFQLLSGTPPFPYKGESLSAYARQVSKSAPPRFRDVSEELDVDPYIESFVLRCLSKLPESRPSSIQELVDSYEMAYRDFQIRSIYGVKSPIEDSSNVTANPPSVSSLPAKPKSTSPPNTAAQAAASDMLPVAAWSDPRFAPNKPAQASARRDSTVELPSASVKPAESTREILRKSEAILEDVDSRLDLWKGLQPPNNSSGSRLADEALREEDSSDVRLSDDDLREEDSSDVRFSDEELQEEDSYYEPGSQPNEPPRPTTAPYRSSSSEKSHPMDTPTLDESPPRSEHISNPASLPAPTPRQAAMDLTPMPAFMEVDSTVAMQKQYLDQLAASPSAPTSQTTQSRPISVLPAPPRTVTSLFAAVVVLAAGLLIYGYVSAARLRREAAHFVEERNYQKAKARLQSAQLLATVWLDRNSELQKILNAGLSRVRDWQRSGKLREAVLETGLIDEAFSGENIADANATEQIREEIAAVLGQRLLNIAKQLQPVSALEETQSDLARAFASVAKTSEKPSQFDFLRVKQDVFAVGLGLAREKSDAGKLDEAMRVLEEWSRAFQDEPAVSKEQKRELEEYLCETRVRKGMADAVRETDSVPPRFADAIMALNRLETELDAGLCAARKPEVLRKRGEIYHAWAESRQGFEPDIAGRFANAIGDFSAVQMALGQPTSRETKAILEKVLLARADTYLARGRFRESQAKNQPAALMLAIKDFQAALADVPQRPEPRQRLAAIRRQALRDAQEAFQSAQDEENHAVADDEYCRSERLLSVVIASCLPREDDHFVRHAKLWRGLAGSSRRVPDFSNAISDLANAVADATESHLTEIGEHVMSEDDPEDRQIHLRRWFALGRSELAWLLSTWPHNGEREAARGQIVVLEQALKATETLASLKLAVDSGKLKPSDSRFRDALHHDECMAQRAYVAALADREQFKKAELQLLALQGSLSLEAKGWQAVLSRDLDEMLNKFLKKGQPFRSSHPQESARICDGQK